MEAIPAIISDLAVQYNKYTIFTTVCPMATEIDVNLQLELLLDYTSLTVK